MAEVASAYVSLMFSAKGAQGQIQDEVSGAAPAAGKKFGSRFTGALKSPLAGLGAVVAGAFAGDAALRFVNDSITKASDLSETVNKSKVIFGANAAEMSKWASTASTSFGLTQEQALASAASFGDMFSQIGFGGKQAAGMSKQVVQLATDLGSFNNLDTSEVLDMISSSFRGEYDSLQRVIPNINAARVETEALAMTGKKSAKELTAQEKAAATLAIVQKDGARAAGDFAKTSTGLANSQKILKASVGDLQADLGALLVPVMAKASTAASGLIRGMREGSGAGGTFVATIKGIGAVLGPVAGFLVKHKTLVLSIVAAYAAWRTISAIINAVKVAQMAYTAITYGAAGATYASGAALKIYTAAMNAQAIAARVSTVATTAWSVATKAAAIASRILGIAIRFMMGPWGLLIAAIVLGVVLVVKNWDKIKAAGARVWGWLKSFIAATGRFLKNIFLNFTPVGQIIKNWDKVKAAGSRVFAAIKAVIARVAATVKSILMNFTPVGQVIQNWGRIKSASSAAVGAIVGFVKSLPGRAASAISGLGSRLVGVIRGISLFSAGSQLIQGLVDGIGSKIQGAIDKVQAGVSKIKGLLPGSPIKWGPLKSWNNGGAGKRLMNVLASGIDKGAGAPVAAMASAAKSLASPLQAPDLVGGVIPYAATAAIVGQAGATSSAAASARYGLTITNWDEGTGYIEELADGRIDAADLMYGQSVRAGAA